MHLNTALAWSSIAATVAYASTLLPRQTTCPPVWSQITQELSGAFEGGKGCEQIARAAIRAAFHDCFPGPGFCDGSLLTNNEIDWPVSRGMEDIVALLQDKVARYGVGNADMIQFAAAHAIRSCTDGPQSRIKIGRTDSHTQGIQADIPQASFTADTLLASFAARGLDHTDLTALIGAHTCANQFFEDESQSGASLDTTPGTWDITFYQQVAEQSAPFTFQSDVSISRHRDTAAIFGGFAGNVTLWEEKFVPAMEKMGMLGVTDVDMIDCTSALPHQPVVTPPEETQE
ncbi:Heme-dependent peroxidase [Glarea lozoyensis ATCC 20868]|uniref:Peroxidase n=1 Tax=Glarea lozoyensis (strain ATCC 20868 / MF5171) TaxID=1116229 RepID=S3CPE0_GLAL2|nr:Heme-dependent peroxidase [Glarea lozoyensis ATCC 20868]EPE28317.1 Heme-dependent peroxidase [Glarea lozoyensis ATCC 20868]